ncbi:hypothetical protein PENTCL1PPCAC_13197, partial [Pristionchus entomophagus]
SLRCPPLSISPSLLWRRRPTQSIEPNRRHSGRTRPLISEHYETIESDIKAMSDEDMQTQEQKHFEDYSKGSDGSSGLPISPVSSSLHLAVPAVEKETHSIN